MDEMIMWRGWSDGWNDPTDEMMLQMLQIGAIDQIFYFLCHFTIFIIFIIPHVSLHVGFYVYLLEKAQEHTMIFKMLVERLITFLNSALPPPQHLC